ncbi:MAG TPA: GNAT family N-acetyltransferase [Polyangiales bacterium]|nr:GNAT family N-acetyltransferase [Polyangiales bacterium]
MTVPFQLRVASVAELHLAHAIDDAAAQLFAQAGIDIDLPDDHPFVVEERARWHTAAEAGGVYFAMLDGAAVGFVALHMLDGFSYVEQLSVRPEHGRHGIGRALLERACALARVRGAREIWLTTYRHLPFNRPFYEGADFAVVPEHAWGPGVRDAISAQRRVLPEPAQRVAMRRVLTV